MQIKEHLGEWFFICGTVLITVALIDVVGFARALMLGCGVSLVAGGIIRVIKSNKS